MNIYLPPGCSQSDVDHAAGEDPEECQECGDLFPANLLDEDGLCGPCAEERRKDEEIE